MNVIVVDTSSWVQYFKVGNNKELEIALGEGRVYLSPVVAAELISGKMTKRQQSQLEDLMRELPLCASDLEHWIRVGILRSSLLSKGLTVSTPDAHVAQCALDLDGYLLSEDRIFQKISSVSKLKLLKV